MNAKTEKEAFDSAAAIRAIVNEKSEDFKKFREGILSRDDVKTVKDLHTNCLHVLSNYGTCLDTMMDAATELAGQKGMEHPELLELVSENREKIGMVKDFLIELKNDYEKEVKKIEKHFDKEFTLSIEKPNKSDEYAICDIKFAVGGTDLFNERCVFQRAAFPHSKGKVPLGILFETMRQIRNVDEVLWCSEDDIC